MGDQSGYHTNSDYTPPLPRNLSLCGRGENSCCDDKKSDFTSPMISYYVVYCHKDTVVHGTLGREVCGLHCTCGALLLPIYSTLHTEAE